MKHARIAWAGAVHHAIERDGQLELQTPAFKGQRLNFDEVVWLPPLAPMPPHRPRTVLALGLNDDFVPALPVGLMKTLSGSGARGLMVDVMTTYGVDSFQGKLAAIIQGSTETTFYVLAVYFGSVNITKTRYALACGLIADAVGLVGAILIGYAFYH